MLSFVVTAFDEMTTRRKRGQNLLQCIRPAQEHEAIGEIIIVDDSSEDFDNLSVFLTGQSKVRLCHNATNRGVFGNKLEAIAKANCDWVVTCDSDNVMDKAYLDKITAIEKSPQTWYCPSFARPKFDYRELSGLYSLQSLKKIVRHRIFSCFFNTGNQTVQRRAFMEVFGKYRDKRADLMMPNYLDLRENKRQTHYWRMVFDACDSFIFNMEWILAGNHLRIVEGLEYAHFYATGEDGNYARSPIEKEKLGRILFDLLRTQVLGAN